MEINKSELAILEAATEQMALGAPPIPSVSDQYLAYAGAVGCADVVFG